MLLVGCSSPSPTEDSRGSASVEASLVTGPSARGVAKDDLGDIASISFAIGQAKRASEVRDTAVQSCKIALNDMGLQFDRSVAIPFRVTAEVTSSAATDVDISLNNISGVTTEGAVGLPDHASFWAVRYSDTPPQCQGPGLSAGAVQWTVAAPQVVKSWSAWLVVPAAITAQDPSGAAAVGKLLISPIIRMSGTLAVFEFDKPAAEPVVQCLAADPALGHFLYIAVDPVIALEHGCSAAGGQSTADKICLSRYPNGSQHRDGGLIIFDRELSLLMVCSGAFGKPEGIDYTQAMECALIAIAAEHSSTTFGVGSNLCEAADVIEALNSGDWLPYTEVKACQFFGKIIAIVGAGFAASASGPGAAEVGIATYTALDAGMTLVCGGHLLDNPGKLGEQLEANYETNVAIEVITHGKCIAETVTSSRWQARDCQ
jgi:hypothetical protein